MAGIVVNLNESDLNDVRTILRNIRNGAPRAIVRTLNRTLDKSATLANTNIRQDIKLTATYIRGKLFKRGASFSNQTAVLSAQKRGVLLSRFKYRELARGGIRVWIKASGASATLPGAFLVHNLRYSGVTAIALPPGSKAPGPSINRSSGRAFDVLYGPSVSQVLTEVKDEIAPELSEFAATELHRQIGVLLGT